MKKNGFFLLFLLLISSSLYATELKLNPQIGSLLQVWGVYGNEAANAQSAQGGTDRRRGFLIRRAELALKEQKDKLSYFLLVDFSKNNFNGTADANGPDRKILQDLFIDYAFQDYFKLRVGQFLYQTTHEGLMPAGDLYHSALSYIGRLYGAQRDLGFWIHGDIGAFNYVAAVQNGDGMNQNAGNKMRLFMNRFSYTFSNKLQLGLWNSWEEAGTNQAGFAENEDHLSGAFFVLPFSNFVFQAEYLGQWKNDKKSGHYALLSYSINPKNRVGVRWDYLKNNPSGNRQAAAEIGYEHKLESYLKFKVDLRLGEERSTGQDRDFQEVIFQTQVAI